MCMWFYIYDLLCDFNVNKNLFYNSIYLPYKVLRKALNACTDDLATSVLKWASVPEIMSRSEMYSGCFGSNWILFKLFRNKCLCLILNSLHVRTSGNSTILSMGISMSLCTYSKLFSMCFWAVNFNTISSVKAIRSTTYILLELPVC